MADTRDEYQGLFDIYWPIGVGVFILIAALVLFVVVRFRSDSDELPEGRDKSSLGEGLYAAALVVVAAALLFFTFTTMSDLEGSPAVGEVGASQAEQADLEIDVTAAKWNWRFDYPAEGITQTGTGVRTPTLVVPADTPVRFDLTSIDVIHSFWIPELRFKRDAFPDRETTFVLVFNEPGFQQGAGECAEFCGLRHAFMDFNVDVKEPEAFEAWVAEHQALEQEGEASAAPRVGAARARASSTEDPS